MIHAAHDDFGTGLRVAREQSGLSLRQIADTTKLSVRALEALEKNRITQLPGGIYRRAIVRSYASEVGLDPEHTLRAFLELHPDEVPTAALPHPVTTSRRGPLSALAGLVGALIPIVAGAVYFAQGAGGSDSPRGPDSRVAGSTPEDTGTVDASLAALSQSPVMMMLSFSARTRLEVMAGGRQVLAREVEAGETLRVELATDVTLVGADAGAVHLSINGQAARTLGAPATPLNARIERQTYHTWLVQP